MRVLLLLSGLLAFVVVGMMAMTPADADGMLLAPSSVLSLLGEQSQIAVVDIRPDKTANINLFISLSDNSTESHEVQFLLPLQTLPLDFAAKEITQDQFRKQRLVPLDNLFWAAQAELAHFRNRLDAAYTLGALAAGPVSLAGRFHEAYKKTQLVPGGGVVAPAATLSVKTAHSSVAVYGSLSLPQLEALAGMPNLPAKVRNTLTGYVNRPFALVRLHTVPAATATALVNLNQRHQPEEQKPGVLFMFSQQMVERDGAFRYDYPLGTGTAWQNPIGLTEVWVTAPEDAPLEVAFPDRPRLKDLTYGKGMLALTKQSAAWAAKGEQVHLASWYQENPDRDVAVLLRRGSESEFVIARRERDRISRVALAFPVLGALTWLLSFAIVVRPHARSKELGTWKALTTSWGFAYLWLTFPALLFTPYPLRARYMFTTPGFLSALARNEIPAEMVWMFLLVCGLLLLGAVSAVYLLKALKSAGAANLLRALETPVSVSFIARSILAGLLAGAIYHIISNELTDWLVGS